MRLRGPRDLSVRPFSREPALAHVRTIIEVGGIFSRLAPFTGIVVQALGDRFSGYNPPKRRDPGVEKSVAGCTKVT